MQYFFLKKTPYFYGTVQEITRKVAPQGVARKLHMVTPNVLNSKAKYGKNMSVKRKVCNDNKGTINSSGDRVT